MKTTWLVSDTHFGHAGVCKFENEDGSKMRPWTDPDEMDEDMVQRWNDRVRPNDKVYHLGDVVINRKALKLLHRLNGDKVLIKGNHDIFTLKDYAEHFRDIRAYHKLDKYLLSHIPIHRESIARWTGGNFHGHLHFNRVKMVDQYRQTVIDPLYLCVCVEHTDFAPISLDDAIVRLNEQQRAAGIC